MAKTQKEEFFIILIIIVILFTPLVSAGFLDWFAGLRDITGRPTTATTTVSAAVANDAPNVTEIDNNVNASFTPNEGSIRSILFSAIVNDTNGEATIDSAIANFSQGSTLRENNTGCTKSELGTDTFSVNFSCTIALQYFDPNGDYVISVQANDSSNAVGINNTVTLTYDILTGMNLSVSALALRSSSPDENNVTNNTDADFLNITNTGNRPTLNISATAIDLSTTSSTTDNLPAENFTFANISLDFDGASFAECVDSTIDANQTTNLVNNTQTQVTGLISRGAAETSSLYLCLRHVPNGIGPFTYDTALGGAWTARVDPNP